MLRSCWAATNAPTADESSHSNAQLLQYQLNLCLAAPQLLCSRLRQDMLCCCAGMCQQQHRPYLCIIMSTCVELDSASITWYERLKLLFEAICFRTYQENKGGFGVSFPLDSDCHMVYYMTPFASSGRCTWQPKRKPQQLKTDYLVVRGGYNLSMPQQPYSPRTCPCCL